LEDAVGELNVTAASINFFVSLVRKANGVVVVISEFLTKFDEAGFACNSDLPAPLVPVEISLRVRQRCRPEQHRDDQGIAHAWLFGGCALIDHCEGID
jgi:hypothetical protein